jgi:hypothetical protein
MVRHRAVRDFTGERQAHEVFGRDVLDGQRLAVAEAEAQVVGGVADEQAAVGAELAQGFDAGFDQARADALPLTVGGDGDRAEGEPVEVVSRRSGGREGDVTDDLASVFGNEREGQRAGVAQCVDDQVFGLMAERMIGKRGDVDALYCGEILFRFGSNDHSFLPHIIRSDSGVDALRPLRQR